MGMGGSKPGGKKPMSKAGGSGSDFDGFSIYNKITSIRGKGKGKKKKKDDNVDFDSFNVYNKAGRTESKLKKFIRKEIAQEAKAHPIHYVPPTPQPVIHNKNIDSKKKTYNYDKFDFRSGLRKGAKWSDRPRPVSKRRRAPIRKKKGG